MLSPEEISSRITSTSNVDSISNLVLDLALELTHSRKGSVLLLDKNSDLIMKAARGLDPELMSSIKIKVGDGICGTVALKKTILFVKDINRDTRIKKNSNRAYSTGSFICCPVLIKGQLSGIINITDKADGSAFTEDDSGTIGFIAAQTALSLEHAYLMAELRTRTAELEKKDKALLDYERFKNEFMALTTHELRTPLNSVAGAVYYLKHKKCTEAEQEEFINIIHDETHKLIKNLQCRIDFSFNEREKDLLKLDAVNPVDILHESLSSKILRNILEKSRVSVSLSLPDSLPLIKADKTYLKQSFINLFDGIIHYTLPEDGIRITANHTDSSVKIELSVRKRNIPEEDMAFLFDEHSLWCGREKSVNRLKFYLAKKNVLLHKGSVSACNSPDGIIIRLFLPVEKISPFDAGTDDLLGLLLSYSSEVMSLNRCSLMLKTPDGELTVRSAVGLSEDIIRSTSLKPGEGISGLAVSRKSPLLIENIEKEPGIARENGEQYTTKSLLCVPVFIDNEVIGVLNMNNKTDGTVFNKKDLYLGRVVSKRISNIINKLRTQKAGCFREIMNDMETLLNAKRRFRKNGKILDLIFDMTNRLGCNENDTESTIYASTLYDLGMTVIDESITMKKGRLTAVEEKIIKTHPFPMTGLLRHMETDDSVTKGILHHHECYDGSGYPFGLKGQSIPLVSRILSVADSYTAMTTEKPYRKALSGEEALTQIREGAGTRFDPGVVDAFVSAIVQ